MMKQASNGGFRVKTPGWPAQLAFPNANVTHENGPVLLARVICCHLIGQWGLLYPSLAQVTPHTGELRHCLSDLSSWVRACESGPIFPRCYRPAGDGGLAHHFIWKFMKPQQGDSMSLFLSLQRKPVSIPSRSCKMHHSLSEFNMIQ